MTKFFCDRCNSEIFLPNISEINIDSCSGIQVTRTMEGIGIPHDERVIEFNKFILCKECSKEFNNVLRTFLRK